MININEYNHWGEHKITSTIQQSIIDAFGKLRYQAKDDPKAFRSILEVIMLDDMLEWAAGLAEPESVLKALFDKRLDLINCNPAFNIQYKDSKPIYTNVNTPQSNDTWKRVWDSENVVVPCQQFEPCDENNECPNHQWIEIETVIFKDKHETT